MKIIEAALTELDTISKAEQDYFWFWIVAACILCGSWSLHSIL